MSKSDVSRWVRARNVGVIWKANVLRWVLGEVIFAVAGGQKEMVLVQEMEGPTTVVTVSKNMGIASEGEVV